MSESTASTSEGVYIRRITTPKSPTPAPSTAHASASADTPVAAARRTPVSARAVPPPVSPPHQCGEEKKTIAAVAADVRGTVEYRAAWDVELWKAIQASRLRQQLEEQKKKAMAALAKFVKSREQETVESCELREREIGRREQKLVEEEKQMEKRKWRLTEMEKDMRNMRQQLADARRRAEAEAQAEVRRAKEDAAHSVALQEQRIHAAEAQTKRAEERLQQAQRDYLTLSEEFHRFRTRELAVPPEKTTSIEARLRSEFAVEQQLLQDRLERRHMEREEHLTRHCRELEEENKRITALATKRKEQLRRTLDEVEHLKLLNKTLEAKLHQQSGIENAAESAGTIKKKKKMVKESAVMPPKMAAADVEPIAKEIERLRSERRAILEGSAGALDVDSDVVRCLDARISDMIGQLYHCGHSLNLVTG